MWIFSAMNLPLIAVDPRTQVPQPRERYPQVIHSAPWSSDDTSFEIFRKYCRTACGRARACPLKEKVALVRFDMKTYTAAAAPSHLVDLCGFM